MTTTSDNEPLTAFTKGARDLEQGLIDNLKHKDLSQLEEILQQVNPEVLADKIVNYISNPSKYTSSGFETPGIDKMIGGLLDKLALIRGRSKIIQEKLSSDEILDSDLLISITREDIDNVFGVSNPELSKITLEDGREVFSGTSGGHRLKKTLKKYKRY